MKNFKSKNNLFEIKLPTGWAHNFEDNVYTFFNEDEMQGVLQISAYFNKGALQFTPDEELLRERQKHPSAALVKLSGYDAVSYGTQDHDAQMLSYYWITGYANVKLFCSLVLNDPQNETTLDHWYTRVIEILNTIKINKVSA